LNAAKEEYVMKIIHAVIVVVAGGLCLSACAGMQKNIGTQRIVERMPGSMPSWAEKSEWDKNDQLYFTGAVTNAYDRALGLREARAEGEKKVIEKIRAKIRTEFGKAIEGQKQENALGTYVKDVIAKVSENVEISGISQSEQYIEKVEERVSHGVRYLYNCHVLLTLSREDYLEARRRVFEGALQKAQAQRNVKAEVSLRNAFDRLGEPRATPTPKEETGQEEPAKE